MKKKGFIEGMREYVALLQKEQRFSTAKSYLDALRSFVRVKATEEIAYNELT